MDFKYSIIGAGVVGLAIAARLSAKYKNIVVLEKNKKFGQETSSRNSEVIHSGIYYPTGSLKAMLCVKGREMLYEYCLKNEIPHRKCGKLVVATTSDECKIVESVLQQSKLNGVKDGKILSQDEIYQIEPEIFALSAVYFPSTGIIDSHSLMKCLETEAMNNGVQFAYGNCVKTIQKLDKGYCIGVSGPNDEIYEFTSEYVINAAGLNAYEISCIAGINNPEYRIYYWKGEYFSIQASKRNRIHSLVYPVPAKHITSLGIHATIDLTNRIKLGPNAIYLGDGIPDYTVNPEHKQAFYESAKKFLPFIELADLEPDQAGVRPKLQKPGDEVRDFIIRNEADKGFAGFVNLVGIESPGLTSCLAIAEFVKKLIK